MSRAPRAPRPLPNNLYNLSAAEADVFGLEEGVVSVDVLQHRLDMLYAMYHNTRYAPRNQHAAWYNIRTTANAIGIEPEAIPHHVATYCGSSYVMPGEVVGSAETCYKKGKRMGDHHGKQHAH